MLHLLSLLLQSLQQVLRAHPYIWVVSLLVTVVLMAAGVLGVLAAAQTETRHRKDSASGARHGACVQQEAACRTLLPGSHKQRVGNTGWHKAGS